VKIQSMMRTHDLALYLHLVGVLTLVGGIVVAAVAQALARRSEGAAEIAAILRAARVGVLLAAPGAVVVVGAGAWLVHLDGLAWDTPWLDQALALLALAIVLGAAGGRRPRHARELAERLRDAGGDVTPELRRLLTDRWSRAANLASAIAMLAILWLMVAKP
jgi:uncharacterized membrane protein